MAIPELLDQLLRQSGPSGAETRPAKVWRDWCEAHGATVGVEHTGSSWATISGGAGAPSLAIVTHIDEIGIRVTHIEDSGLICIGEVGMWDPVNLVGQRVALDTLGGAVIGVIGRKAIHQLEAEERKVAPQMSDLRLDVGAASAEEASALVRIGDVGVVVADPIEMPNGRVVSRALDNRVGCYVSARVLELLTQAGGAPGDVTALAVVQEELGFFGAQTAAYSHRPQIAVAIDVTHESGAPGYELGPSTKHEFGSGPSISRSATLHPGIFELLYETARAESIPFTLASEDETSDTDADALHVSRNGIPTALVSVPLRYMHSPVEMIDLTDLENTARLIAAFARRLQAGMSLAR